jgi:hypothetical protein
MKSRVTKWRPLIRAARAEMRYTPAGRKRSDPAVRVAESIEHKGHTIVVLQRATGWRVYIRPPDAPMRRAEFAAALSREQVIAEAARLVDEAAATARGARRRQ